jgi:ProP effector
LPALTQAWHPAGKAGTLNQKDHQHTFAEKSEGTPYERQVISELVAAFPAVFTLDPTLVRPVKLGIKKDLFGQSAISRRRITAALRAYCNSVQYLKASVEGAVRIDLAGEPAGAVTTTEARHAREALAAIANANSKDTTNIASSRSGPKAPQAVTMGHPSRGEAAQKDSEPHNRLPTEAATPGQKRSSLSDLKLAATARKAKR